MVTQDLSASYYYLESRIHIKDKEYHKAITSLENVRIKDPDSIEITRDLIRLYLRQNDEKKALALSENMVKNNPDNVDGLLLLVHLKKDKLDDKDLVKILNRVLELDPDNSTLNFFAGISYEASEKYETAISYYSKILPGHAQYKKTF